MKNYYDILGVSKTSSQEEIKKKYRELSKMHHPDKGGDEEVFKKINEAYSTLSDPSKRAEYDNPVKTYSGGMSAEDVYNMAFGRQQRRQESFKIDPHVNINMSLTMEEVFNGVNKTIKYSAYTACGDCNTEGGHDSQTCTACSGRGFSVFQRGPVIMQQTCGICQGTGKTFKKGCNTCDSFGYVKQDRQISVNIPASVLHGETITYHNYGNEVKKNLFGHLTLTVTVKQHDVFIRPNDAPFDLVQEIHLPYHDIILGCDTIISTISGTNVKINIPELTNNGKVLRLKGQGFKKRQNGVGVLSTRGDMHVLVTLKMPTEISEAEKEILRNLKKESEVVETI